jgi:ribosomal protein S4
MVVHKKVMIENKVNNTPSYIVPVALESHISIRQNKKAPKQEKKEESAPAGESN